MFLFDNVMYIIIGKVLKYLHVLLKDLINYYVDMDIQLLKMFVKSKKIHFMTYYINITEIPSQKGANSDTIKVVNAL